MVDDGSDVPGLSPGGGELNRLDSFRLKHGLVMVHLSQLGLNGHLLTSEFTSPLCRPALSVDLRSTGSHLLPFLIGLLSLKRKPGVRPPSRMVWHGCDGDRRCHHATFFGRWGSRSSPL
jgi:hypothetical protein